MQFIVILILSIITVSLVTVIFYLKEIFNQNKFLISNSENIFITKTSTTPVFSLKELNLELNWSIEAYAQLRKLKDIYTGSDENIKNSKLKGTKKEILYGYAYELIRKDLSATWHGQLYKEMVTLNLDAMQGKKTIEEAKVALSGAWPMVNEREINELFEKEKLKIDEVYDARVD